MRNEDAYSLLVKGDAKKSGCDTFNIVVRFPTSQPVNEIGYILWAIFLCVRTSSCVNIHIMNRSTVKPASVAAVFYFLYLKEIRKSLTKT